jgi:DNA polymerase-1
MISSEYKAHRDATRSHKNSSSLHSGFTKSHAHSYIAGYEADDLIGTIAKQAEKQNYKCLW